MAKNERLVTLLPGECWCGLPVAGITAPSTRAAGGAHPRFPRGGITNLSFLAKTGGYCTNTASSSHWSPRIPPRTRARRADKAGGTPPRPRGETDNAEKPPALPSSNPAGTAAARGNRRRRSPGRQPRAEDKRRGKPGASRLASKAQLSPTSASEQTHR